jgi:hypothetical protein
VCGDVTAHTHMDSQLNVCGDVTAHTHMDSQLNVCGDVTAHSHMDSQLNVCGDVTAHTHMDSQPAAGLSTSIFFFVTCIQTQAKEVFAFHICLTLPRER